MNRLMRQLMKLTVHENVISLGTCVALSAADGNFVAQFKGHREQFALLVPIVHLNTQLSSRVVQFNRVPGCVIRGKLHCSCDRNALVNHWDQLKTNFVVD